MIRTRPIQGSSDAARYIDGAAAKCRMRLQSSSALGSSSVVDDLADIWEDCRHPGWDGYDAVPVSQDTLRNAYQFLEDYAMGWPRPSVGAEPDGQITFEWHHGPRRTLSVSVTPDGNLHYAALLGPNRRYGTEAFFGEVPAVVLDLVSQVWRR
jgi:hypothetical protein